MNKTINRLPNTMISYPWGKNTKNCQVWEIKSKSLLFRRLGQEVTCSRPGWATESVNISLHNSVRAYLKVKNYKGLETQLSGGG